MIHAREADEDVAAILDDHPKVTVILHSFSSGMGLLRAGLVHRHYVSFSGMVTFKNWRLDEAIRETPLDRLLVERIAAVRELPVEELIAITGENAERVFQLQSGVRSRDPGARAPGSGLCS